MVDLRIEEIFQIVPSSVEIPTYPNTHRLSYFRWNLCSAWNHRPEHSSSPRFPCRIDAQTTCNPEPQSLSDRWRRKGTTEEHSFWKPYFDSSPSETWRTSRVLETRSNPAGHRWIRTAANRSCRGYFWAVKWPAAAKSMKVWKAFRRRSWWPSSTWDLSEFEQWIL